MMILQERKKRSELSPCLLFTENCSVLSLRFCAARELPLVDQLEYHLERAQFEDNLDHMSQLKRNTKPVGLPSVSFLRVL